MEEQNPPENNSWSIKSIKHKINEQKEGKNQQNKNKKVKVQDNIKKEKKKKRIGTPKI